MLRKILRSAARKALKVASVLIVAGILVNTSPVQAADRYVCTANERYSVNGKVVSNSISIYVVEESVNRQARTAGSSMDVMTKIVSDRNEVIEVLQWTFWTQRKPGERFGSTLMYKTNKMTEGRVVNEGSYAEKIHQAYLRVYQGE